MVCYRTWAVHVAVCIVVMLHSAQADSRPAQLSSLSAPALSEFKVESSLWSSVRQIQSDLELLRLEMGVEYVEPLEVTFRNGSLLEALSVSRSLAEKLDRIMYEQLREHSGESASHGELSDVEQVSHNLDRTITAIEKLLTALRVKEEQGRLQEEASQGVDEFLQQLHRANHHASLLLRDPVDPGDVFEEVTRGLSYAIGIRSLFPGKRIPDSPPLLRRKTPRDVLQELKATYELTQLVAERFETSGMVIEWSLKREVRPSDVLEVAHLISTQLQSLHSKIAPEREERFERYHPGVKFSSHVHQRVRLLQEVLNDTLRQRR